MIKIAFLDVGNADSIVATTASQSAIVVDVPKPRKVENWLEQQNCAHIDALFFTHNHRDHIPSLPTLVTFLEGWLKTKTVEHLYIPTEYIRSITTLTDEKSQRARNAVDKLTLWGRKGLTIQRAEIRGEPLTFGEITVQILHPSFLFVEQQSGHKQNEPSLVLSLKYGNFKTLLLADVEGKGLEALLDNSRDDELKCNVIKIPHHGSWQAENERALQQLFDRTDAEFAVLSVGSTNRYGHVHPQLFRELLERKMDSSKQLFRFVCTEVTKTCVYAADVRESMGRQGLAKKRPCAGDVIIQAELDGRWVFQTEIDHNLHLQTIERPACLGKADL